MKTWNQTVKVWGWTRDNAAVLTVLFAVIGGTWHLSSTLATREEVNGVREEVNTVRTTVDDLSQVVVKQDDVAIFGQAVDVLSGSVATVNTAVQTLNGTVGAVNTTVQNLSGAVADTRATVQNLSGAVADTRATVQNLSGAVADTRATVDALSETIAPLVSCMVLLHTSDLDIPAGAAVDVEALLPAECRQAIRLSETFGQ